VTIEPEYIAILITIVMPAAVLGAAALNALTHKGKDNDR
jgi:hypothetical protein